MEIGGDEYDHAGAGSRRGRRRLGVEVDWTERVTKVGNAKESSGDRSPPPSPVTETEMGRESQRGRSI